MFVELGDFAGDSSVASDAEVSWETPIWNGTRNVRRSVMALCFFFSKKLRGLFDLSIP